MKKSVTMEIKAEFDYTEAIDDASVMYMALGRLRDRLIWLNIALAEYVDIRLSSAFDPDFPCIPWGATTLDYVYKMLKKQKKAELRITHINGMKVEEIE